MEAHDNISDLFSEINEELTKAFEDIENLSFDENDRDIMEYIESDFPLIELNEDEEGILQEGFNNALEERGR